MNILFSNAIYPLLGAMLVEGASIPFPGILVVLAFGSTMRPSLSEAILISLVMALIYTLATFLPYAIGRKFGNKVLAIFDENKKIKSSIEKSKELVKKYGIITIAISRFFGWGNKISYIAGISKINCIPYGILTFSGIFIWSFAILNLGKIFKNDTTVLLEVIEKYTIYVYIVVIIVILVYLLIAYLRYKETVKLEDK